MGFNYAAERNKFENKWKKLRKEYAEYGLPTEKIEMLYQDDLAEFNGDRSYYRNTVSLEECCVHGDEGDEFEVSYMKKCVDAFVTQYDAYGTHSRYWWLEELSDPRLVAMVSKLTDEEKELLTLRFVEQYTTREIAPRYNTSHTTITNRIKVIISKIASA